MTEYLVTIRTDGEVEIDAQDGQGTSCKDDVQKLLKALGDTQEEQKKPEYYQTVGGGQKVGNGGNVNV